jgi:hypothetical protein
VFAHRLSHMQSACPFPGTDLDNDAGPPLTNCVVEEGMLTAPALEIERPQCCGRVRKRVLAMPEGGKDFISGHGIPTSRASCSGARLWGTCFERSMRPSR